MDFLYHKEMRKTGWLPHLIATMGTIFSIFLCYLLLQSNSAPLNLTALIPWFVLFIGILLSLVLALVVHFSRHNRKSRRLLRKINEDFKREIADRIHAEETKQKLEKALLQGQKLQAIGTLAGGIAHDFNNLLYAVIGYVDMAREDVPQDSIVHANLGKVILAAHRGQELIARILAFSRRQHHDLLPICLKDTIEGVLALLNPTIPASVNIHFSVNLVNPNNFILGNQTQLHQIIVNIINNAVDAMDGEGTVTLNLTRILANDEMLEQFPQISDSDYFKIDITDTGHGMDQGMLERIFEPFFTTKEVGKGTGLGLATVHAIIEEHKAEILVSSQLGRGTTFTILFPEYVDKEN